MKILFKRPLLVLAVACLPAIYFLLRKGFYEPQDLHHIADIFEMYRALVSGQFPPRMGPDYLWNFGYPLFNFYYVLPFYLGTIFYALTRSLSGAFEFVFVVSAIFSVFGMYLFLREFFGKAASLAGSILYLYSPYRAVQIYVRGAMGEALAMAAVPFVFWGAARVIKNPNKSNILVLTLSLGALILSHNYIWLLTAPWLALFLLIGVTRIKNKLKSIKAIAFGVILGAGITAYWWLPAVRESGLVSSLTPFLLEDHFPFIKQLLIPSWGYGASLPGPYDGMSFQIGIINLAAVLFAFGIILIKRKNLEKYKSVLVVAFLGFLVSALMMNIRTLPIWKLLPIYQFVQFPWRLLFLTTFFSATLAAFVIELSPKRLHRFLGLAVVILSMALTWGYFRPSRLVNKPDDFYLSRMFATMKEVGEKEAASKDYVNWSEDYLLLPPNVKKASSLFLAKVVGDDNLRILNLEKINPIHFKAEIEAGIAGKLTFYSINFPGWYSKVDGVNAPITQGMPYGQIEVIIPSGKHAVEFYWAETPLRKIGDFISLISIGVVIVLIYRSRKNHGRA